MLRNRVASVKRKRHLWRRFRIAAWVVGTLGVKRRDAAERAYAPGGAGFVEASVHFGTACREMLEAAAR